MKKLLPYICILFGIYCNAQPVDSLLAVFWNLENLFDHIDQGTGESDKEFSSMGTRRWTGKRFYTKCDAVSKSLMWIGDRYGRIPDIIGLAEIENKAVLQKLLSTTLLRKYDYRIIHHDSGDRRGIDVAILYRSSSMDTVCTSTRTPVYEGKKMATRDILHARMCLSNEDTVDFIVNHHPSKFGGKKESSGRRNAAMEALSELCLSLRSDKIVAMGDFNDTPDAPAFKVVEDILVNKASPLHERGEGTIRYEGKWDLIDMFLVSVSLDGRARMSICRIPFLMTVDRKHPGEKPLRTYGGPRYLGGVSDHCPIVLSIKWD